MNKQIKNQKKNHTTSSSHFPTSLHWGQSKLKFDTIMSAKPKNKKPTD
jgi:hypothetical protein